MAKKISYAVLLSNNLKHKALKIDQIEVVIDISGASPDPLTLQQIRDEPTIVDYFKSHRQNVNKLVEETAGKLAKVKDKQEAEKLVAEMNKKLATELNKMEKELQARADKFVQKQKKEVNDLFWARAKIGVRILWSAAKLIMGAIELPAKVGAITGATLSGAGAFISAVAVKSLIGTANDLMGIAGEIISALEGERSQFAKLQAAVKELKKLKEPAPVPKSKIDAVENMLGPYGARLLGVDATAKNAAVKLNKLLKDMDKGQFRNAKALEALEQSVDKLIKKIIKLSKNAAEGRKLLQGARQKIQDVSKRAKNDSSTFWSLAGGLWKALDYVMDTGDSYKEGLKTGETFKECMKALGTKLGQELGDAVSEKKLKL